MFRSELRCKKQISGEIPLVVIQSEHTPFVDIGLHGIDTARLQQKPAISISSQEAYSMAYLILAGIFQQEGGAVSAGEHGFMLSIERKKGDNYTFTVDFLDELFIINLSENDCRAIIAMLKSAANFGEQARG